MIYVVAYDFGTTGVKTCLYEIDRDIRLAASAYGSYGLYIFENGGAEQDCDEWWRAMCDTTKELFEKIEIKPEQIAGISFCSQMQGIVLVDEQGNAVRRPMSYMDQRAVSEFHDCMGNGIKVSGCNVWKLLKSLSINHAASTSVKDPLWKYKWVEKNEPELFARVHKWLDVKEYLICRCTGEFVMTRDSAYATFLYDTRPGREGWNDALCHMYGVKPEHLPRLIECTEQAGRLTEKAAAELGLTVGTPVFGGGGDATIIGVGAGCTIPGDTHIYSGTSGWVSTVTDRQVVDINRMIAAIVGAQTGRFNYFAEMETAGKCFEWVKEHLALDEIGIYLEKTDVAQSQESVYESLYDYLTDTVKNAAPGAGEVIFTPWLHGNRCPFEDPNASGMFFNIKLDTGKTEMIRAVLEGICYHLRWMLECQDQKIKTSDTIRFVGGGALSELTCQILANITGRTIETVSGSQDVGAVGAALLVGVGTGEISSLDCVKELVKAEQVFTPDLKYKALYDRNFIVFKKLYQTNKENFRILNEKQ
ncbi:MAG: FGGY-family carbohydrate kinase [bacterium]|nr:FGGY-family carbohydrate kinase [bacterium]